jgi:phenylpropionate dioxygenase-like ring-hydroxylating dioxygenase large terminal subunit
MTFLQNAWYAAGWSHMFEATPLARTIHDQPIVIYRGEAGAPIALADKCPHRFAPLSRGKIKGDRIACGYHGLEFDSSGQCVRNPHGRLAPARRYPRQQARSEQLSSSPEFHEFHAPRPPKPCRMAKADVIHQPDSGMASRIA